MATINVEQFSKINEQLEGIISFLDEYSKTLENKSNEQIEKEIKKLSKKLEPKLNEIRDKVVENTKKQYQSTLKIIEPLEPIMNLPTDPMKILDWASSVVEFLTKPYQPAIDFVTELTPEIVKLSNNLIKVSSYKPNVPNVDVPPLEINIKPISIGDITG